MRSEGRTALVTGAAYVAGQTVNVSGGLSAW